MRVTLDIEAVVLEQMKEIQRREGDTLGAIASRLLAEALGPRGPARAAPFRWTTRRMEARVDLGDKDAVSAILGRPDRAAEP